MLDVVNNNGHASPEPEQRDVPSGEDVPDVLTLDVDEIMLCITIGHGERTWEGAASGAHDTLEEYLAFDAAHGVAHEEEEVRRKLELDEA
ncbi:hypothetical protein LTR86_009332 [Recurvomyces mirabilis]|nr:hypothetical protein LTR86_009332 [Recurvomyces mirabilis]